MINPKTGQWVTPDNITPQMIIDLWQRGANRLKPSRERIIECRDMRRNLIGIEIPDAFLRDYPEAAAWAGIVLPERQMWDINLVNQLSESDPQITRTPLGQTDTASDDADKLEMWDNTAVGDTLFGENGLREIRGRAVADGEFAMVISPNTRDLRKLENYEPGQESDNYNRDANGRPQDHKSYSGKRHPKQSAKAAEEARVDWIAAHFPLEKRIVEACDCAPILVRGKAEAWEPRHLIVRTLYEREELLRSRRWDGMMDQGTYVQRAYDADEGDYSPDTYGRGKMVYLYEAFLTLEDDNGDDRIVVARCVGGRSTWAANVDTPEQKQVDVIDMTKEYGITERFWEYFWGLRLSDEPAFAGIPVIYPLMGVLKALEALISAHNMHTWDNAFGGHTMTPDNKLNAAAYMDQDSQKLLAVKKPGPGEIVVTAGPVEPFNKSVASHDASYMEQFFSQKLEMHQPDRGVGEQPKSASGHAQLVSQKLMEVGKSDIRRTVLHCTRFAGYQVNMWACALKKSCDISLAVYATEEVPGEGFNDATSVSRPIEINERWIGKNYRVEAGYLDVENLMEIDLKMSAAERGFGSDIDVYKAMGKTSIIQARLEAAAYTFWKSPEGQQRLQMVLARKRQDTDYVQLLELQQQGRVDANGVPMAAMAQEAQGQPGGPPPPQNNLPPGVGAPSQTSVTRARGGVEAGQLRAAALQRDALATSGLGNP